ncbi:MAG: hypothetical protein QXN59_00635 [Candidatus Micrarchaeaceae archaeon]
MDEQKKKKFLFFGSLFVAAIFLSSYASFGNNGSPIQSNSTTTISSSRIVPIAIGYVNGTVVGYSNSFSLRANNGTNKTLLSNFVNKLEANGSINSFSVSGGSYLLDQGTMDAYNVSSLIAYDRLNATVSADLLVKLPHSALLSNNNNPYETLLPNFTYSISSSNIIKAGSQIKLKLLAVIYTDNGTLFKVYNNNITVTAQN